MTSRPWTSLITDLMLVIKNLW